VTHESTWRPHPTHGKLAQAQLDALPKTAFAFPEHRALPLTDEGYVRSAIEDFDQVEGVSDDERGLAFANIQKAAHFYHVPMTETDWRELGSRHVEPGYRAAESDRI
jgi:hypothetical protein